MLGTLGASLLGDMLFSRKGKGVIRAGEGTIRAGYGSKPFEIQAYYRNEPRFIGVYSRDNLPDKIKDGAYVINLDDSIIGTHWIAL